MTDGRMTTATLKTRDVTANGTTTDDAVHATMVDEEILVTMFQDEGVRSWVMGIVITFKFDRMIHGRMSSGSREFAVSVGRRWLCDHENGREDVAAHS